MTSVIVAAGGAGVDEPDPVLVATLRQRVTQRLAGVAGPVSVAERGPMVARLIAQVLDEHTRALIDAGRSPLAPTVEAALARQLRDGLTGLGGLQPLLDDPSIENINVNGHDRVWVRYADGRRARVGAVASSDEELVELVRTVAARSGSEERRFDRGCPRLSLRLADGSRLFAVMAVTGRVSVSIRRHRFLRVSLDDLVVLGTLTPGLAALFAALVRARRNTVVSGGTGAGKTTFVRALASAIGSHERLVTVEDAYELALDEDPAHPDTVPMQAREANIEGQGAIDMAELVRWALRMSPDRVIVGEVRGPEVVPMLNALSQGNDGSMCTIHSSSSQQAFTRLATYAIQSPERLAFDATYALVAGAVHVVVHLDHTADGKRVVSSVREVVGFDGTQIVSNEIYRPGPDRRAVPAAPIRASTMDDLVAAGFDPSLLDRDRW